MEKIKIAICDDFDYLCQSYAEILGKEMDFEVIWTANNCTDCLEHIKKNPPEILLQDIQMEDEESGLQLISQIRSINESVKVIILTSFDYDDYILKAFGEGAANYIIKDEENDKIIETIRKVSNGVLMLENKIASKVAEHTKKLYTFQKSAIYMMNKISTLTRTEFLVLKYIVSGKTNAQIAEINYVEENTVRKVTSNILHKFGMKNKKILIDSIKEMQLLKLFE